MRYTVLVLRKAEIQLNQNALWWAENRSARQAIRWLGAFSIVIESLCDNPERYATASENHLFDFTLRQIAFGVGHGATHRALFTVRGDKVYVYSIRHLAQRDVTPEDFQ